MNPSQSIPTPEQVIQMIHDLLIQIEFQETVK